MGRILKIVGAIIAVPAIAIIALMTFIANDYTDTEIARYPNPSGSMEAIVVERNAGATVPFITLIYVVPSKAKPTDKPIFVADHVEGLSIHWSDDKKAIVRADNARVSDLHYYFGESLTGVVEYEIARMGRRRTSDIPVNNGPIAPTASP